MVHTLKSLLRDWFQQGLGRFDTASSLRLASIRTTRSLVVQVQFHLCGAVQAPTAQAGTSFNVATIVRFLLKA